MRENEDVPPAGRSVRESEIFREPPGSGDYTSSIGAAVGIELFQGRGLAQRARSSKTIVEPEREVPVLAETDVLVVGGGPAGTAAAIAAARLGADVLLIERYNRLGGLHVSRALQGYLALISGSERHLGPRAADIR
jgi:NADPH-dependent 2,4-dienoyl-CoA reductase/sulfur reductase-like enzyme